MSSQKVRTPEEGGELLAKVTDIVGGDDRVKVMCEDGKARIARIPGKYRRRMWMRVGDYVLVIPWDFEPNKADVVYKYDRGGEVNELRRSEHGGEKLAKIDELTG